MTAALFCYDKSRFVLCRPEFYYVSKHASWLNMVEIEISVLAGQSLDRRSKASSNWAAETATWERQRNAAGARTNRMFTTEKPRWGGPIRSRRPRHGEIKQSKSL
jgi:hypothetical protein